MQSDHVKKILYTFGADVCGIASVDRFADAPAGFAPSELFPACRSVIVFGLALPKGVLASEPRLVYTRYNELSTGIIDTLAFRTARRLEDESGCMCVPLPCDRPYECWEPDRMYGHGLLSVKHAAVQAGLGTLGKNTLLLNPQFGNRLTIGVILTDLELAADPLCAPVCLPGCTRCMRACPVGAIQPDGTVNQQLCRPNAYGNTVRGDDAVNCRACRTACPQRFGRISPPDAARPDKSNT